MSERKITSRFVIAVACVAVSIALHSQQPAVSASKSAGKTASSQVHTITLPKYPPEIPPGPNVEVYTKDCLTCHTARYVSMQPRFPKSVWQSEIKKMTDAYGAAIPDADQPLILEYLLAVKGTEAPPSAPPPPK
jgi:hypothetical protein